MFFSSTRGRVCPTEPFATEVFELNEHHFSTPSKEIEAEKGIPAGPMVMIWFDVVLQFTVVAASEAEEMPRSTLSLLSEQPVKRAIRATKIEPDLTVENKVLKDIQKRGKTYLQEWFLETKLLTGLGDPAKSGWFISRFPRLLMSVLTIHIPEQSLQPGHSYL